jgi:hypothetical protein
MNNSRDNTLRDDGAKKSDKKFILARPDLVSRIDAGGRFGLSWSCPHT